MRLNIEDAPPAVLSPSGPQVGGVYKVQGGRGGPRFQVVAAIGGNTAYMLVFREDGEICGIGQCGLHYLDRREIVGTAEIPDIHVEWSGL